MSIERLIRKYLNRLRRQQAGWARFWFLFTVGRGGLGTRAGVGNVEGDPVAETSESTASKIAIPKPVGSGPPARVRFLC